MIKASDLLVECLEAEGVEYVFGVPGEENLDLLDSLSRRPIAEPKAVRAAVERIEVPVDYSENDHILNHEIHELSAAL
jgi:thiamine pyrophosphate-dependent acetolactate synthase large subunit-like protein